MSETNQVLPVASINAAQQGSTSQNPLRFVILCAQRERCDVVQALSSLYAVARRLKDATTFLVLQNTQQSMTTASNIMHFGVKWKWGQVEVVWRFFKEKNCNLMQKTSNREAEPGKPIIAGA